MHRLAYVFALLAACATTADSNEPGDGINDADVTISPNSPEARGVLRVANELTFQQLDVDVALPSNAARNIVAHRVYTTLAQLDAVPYVGPSAFAKMLAYARAHGYVVAPSRFASCPGYVVPEPAVCGDEQWSWERPTPSGQRLSGVTTFGANDVWAVGGGGSVMHFNGGTWQVERTPVCEALTAVWGTSATNLWAVGEAGRILHRTANGWTIVDSGTCERLSDVWGSPSGTVWITSETAVLHGDATHAFTSVALDPDVRLSAIHGFSDTNIWGVDSGRIFHWDGTTWTLTASGHWDLESIWGSDPDHLVVGGFAWDSNATAAWTFGAATAATPTMKVLSGNRTATVGGSGPNDMWLAQSGQVWRFDGTTWSYVSNSNYDEIDAIAMVTPTEGWAVGESGARMHWNGTAWTDVDGERHGYSSMFALAANDAWVSSYKGLLHWDGSAWTNVAAVTGFFNAVWASSAHDVWAVGLNVQHFDGTAWSTVTLPQASGFTQGGWYTVGGSGPSDIWIGGSYSNYTGKLAHWNGTQWSAVSPGVNGAVRGIYAPAPNNAWLATDNGLVHWDGNLWSIAGPLNVGKLHRVFGTGPNDLWATGGSVYHYDGNTWTEMIHGTSSFEEFEGVWGRSSTDVWVAGGGIFGGASKLMHWDGTRWTTHVNPTSGLPVGIAGTGTTVWAVDTGGGLIRYRP